ERIQNHFPFLSLPAEIRNKVYRLVLLTENVVTDIANFDKSFTLPGEGADGVGPIQPSKVAFGSIRCVSCRTYTIGYQTAILLTNRQIHREAQPLFQLENFWALIRFNRAGVGRDLRDHGFPVATGDNLRRKVKSPVLKVAVQFSRQKGGNQCDTVAVATVHLERLMRALWTAQGGSEMEVTINVQPPPTNNSPSERNLLWPFFKLRSIKRLEVYGASEQGHIDELTSAITTTDGINQTLHELAAGVRSFQEYVNTEYWIDAIEELFNVSVLTADCEIAFGRRYRGIGPGMDTTLAFARYQIVREVFIASAMAGAEIVLHMGDRAYAIVLADRALGFLSRDQHIIPVLPTVGAHPSHQLPPLSNQLPPLTAITTSPNETKCNIYLLQARAHIGMRQADDAFRTMQAARDLVPNSVELASVIQAWKVTFRAIPGSAPPPGPY
ncbi:hypothetical protein MMC22_008332, partial [Lobaria immixta]|nr:hypothetical protein [Lobaria immixta]